MAHSRRMKTIRALMLGTALAALSGCETFDIDLRPGDMGTAEAARNATAARPPADDRGVISYPHYQVVVARRGDTVEDVAHRIGLDATELARYNGIDPGVPLRAGEILALPRRVSEPSPATGAIATGPIRAPGERIDITTLADQAIGQTGRGNARSNNAPAVRQGIEPIRHKVGRGETAYSISRLYNVSVRALAEWNGLGPDLAVREGQYLLIPVARDTDMAAAPATAPAAARPIPRKPPENRPDATPPGKGTPTPPPPSAAKPLPREDAAPQTAAAGPPSPDLGAERTAASDNSRLAMPAQGKIIRAFSKKSQGIDIAAAPGTPVHAAGEGTVAAITKDTDGVPIVVIRHADNLLTVYANLDAITVRKGDRVKRGQKIAAVRRGNPAFMHFEVRKGFDAVDPMPYLK